MAWELHCDACHQPIAALVPFVILLAHCRPQRVACSDACALKLDPTYQPRAPQASQDQATRTFGAGCAVGHPAKPIGDPGASLEPDRLGPVDLEAFLRSCGPDAA